MSAGAGWSIVEVPEENREKEKEALVLTVSSALDHYLGSGDWTPRVLGSITSQLRQVKRILGGVRVDELDGTHLSRYRRERKLRVRHSTINRELAYLRAALRMARKDSLIERVPEFRLTRETTVREGYLAREEVEQVSAWLDEHDSTCGDLVRFLFWTGWRISAALGLEWDSVSWMDATITLEARRSKNRKMWLYPISRGPVREVLERRREARDEDCSLVFHRHGKPIRAFRKRWRSALEACGLRPDIVPHSLRRSFATHMVARAAQPEKVVMALGGFMTDSILRRYTITRSDVLLGAIDKATSAGA